VHHSIDFFRLPT